MVNRTVQQQDRSVRFAGASLPVPLAVLLALESAAHAGPDTTGVMIGLSKTRLDGHLVLENPDWATGYGFAVPISWELGDQWGVGVQPGIRRTGSSFYSIDVLSAPLVGDLRFQRGKWRLRASAGVGPEWVWNVTLPGADGGTSSSPDRVPRWNIGALGALAVEFSEPDRPVTWIFLELRVVRQLLTLDKDGDLDIYPTDIGLWVGLRW
jgi:hypothetical protein